MKIGKIYSCIQPCWVVINSKEETPPTVYWMIESVDLISCFLLFWFKFEMIVINANKRKNNSQMSELIPTKKLNWELCLCLKKHGNVNKTTTTHYHLIWGMLIIE